MAARGSLCLPHVRRTLAGSTKVLGRDEAAKKPPVYAVVASAVAFMGPKWRWWPSWDPSGDGLLCLWVRLPCLRQHHAGRDISRVRGERRVGGQLLRVRCHHRGEVEHGRPPPLGSHEGHRRGDDCVYRWFLCCFISSKDLLRPCKCLPDMRKTKGSAGGHLDYVLPLQLAGNICSENG